MSFTLTVSTTENSLINILSTKPVILNPGHKDYKAIETYNSEFFILDLHGGTESLKRQGSVILK